MAEVLARALALRSRHDKANLEVTLGLHRLVVPAAAANDAVDAATSRGLPYGRTRDFLRNLLVRALCERYVDLAGVPAEGSELDGILRRAPALKSALDRRCPTVAPATLVSELLSGPGCCRPLATAS